MIKQTIQLDGTSVYENIETINKPINVDAINQEIKNLQNRISDLQAILDSLAKPDEVVDLTKTPV